jgi:hypothetical protein
MKNTRKIKKQNSHSETSKTETKLSNSIFKENIYTNFSVLDLVTLGIYLVSQKKETCTFERLVAECFTHFPKVFGLKRYPQWPDTLKFDRVTRTLREKGLVIGGIGGKKSPGEFKLTEFGISVAKNIEKIITKNHSSKYAKEKSSATIRSIDDKLIDYIRQNVYYKRYTQNSEAFSISEAELRNLLRCTLETPTRVVKQNLTYFINTAKEYREKEILDFLLTCESKIFTS